MKGPTMKQLREFLYLKKDIKKLIANNKIDSNFIEIRLKYLICNAEEYDNLIVLHSLLTIATSYFNNLKIYRLETASQDQYTYSHSDPLPEKLMKLSQTVVWEKNGVAADSQRSRIMIYHLSGHTHQEIQEAFQELRVNPPTHYKTPPENVVLIEGNDIFSCAYFSAEFNQITIITAEETPYAETASRFNWYNQLISQGLFYVTVSQIDFKNEEVVQAYKDVLQNQKLLTTQKVIEEAQENIRQTCSMLSNEWVEKAIIDLQDTITNYMQKISIRNDEIEQFYNLMNVATTRLAQLVNNSEGIPNDTFELLVKFEQILSIEKSEKGFKVAILAPITFDEDLLSPKLDAFKGRKWAIDFLKDVRDGHINVKLVSVIDVDIKTGAVTAIQGESEELYKQLFLEGDIIRLNTHHYVHGCFGSFRNEIINTIKNKNWLAVGLILIQAVSQLNLADNVVAPRFFLDLENKDPMFNYKGKAIYLRDYRKEANNGDNS